MRSEPEKCQAGNGQPYMANKDEHESAKSSTAAESEHVVNASQRIGDNSERDDGTKTTMTAEQDLKQSHYPPKRKLKITPTLVKKRSLKELRAKHSKQLTASLNAKRRERMRTMAACQSSNNDAAIQVLPATSYSGNTLLKELLKTSGMQLTPNKAESANEPMLHVQQPDAAAKRTALAMPIVSAAYAPFAASSAQRINATSAAVTPTTPHVPALTRSTTAAALQAAWSQLRIMSDPQLSPLPATPAVSEPQAAVLPSAAAIPPAVVGAPMLMPRPIIFARTNCANAKSIFGQCKQACYRIIELIGKGTFGNVYKAANNCSQELVALKRVRSQVDEEGCALTAIREVNILGRLQHENVITLRNVFVDNSKPTEGFIYLVFDYMEHDLFSLVVTRKVHFTELQIASIMKQLLAGLQHCHQRNVLHRDIKSTNILMNQRGIIKLADFGLARVYGTLYTMQRPFTNKVVTLWYRPPELLLGEDHYGSEIDIWSCGCILGELLLQKPLFSATSELNLLDLIARLCGTPEPTQWPSVNTLPLFSTMQCAAHARQVRHVFAFAPEAAQDVLDGLLVLNPARRLTIAAALEMPWLKNVSPQATPPPTLPSMECHEYHLRLNRKLATARDWEEV